MSASVPATKSITTKGRLYGASLGPGDPGLITRHTWDILQSGAYWTYPQRNKKSDSYALSIALSAGLELPAQHSPLIFPMTHDVDILAGYWLKAAQFVLDKLTDGIDVVFLVEGDASTYSTFGHLAKTVSSLDDSIDITTIAGVPSYHAASASLKMPLADVDDTVAIIPAGYGLDMIERLLADFDTIVLLKVKPLLDDIINLLERKGLIQHCRFVEKAGSIEERIINDVRSLKDSSVNYLSLMIIKNPLRNRGDMIRGCRKKSISTIETNSLTNSENVITKKEIA